MDRFFNMIYSVPYFQGFIERISIYYWGDINVPNPPNTMVRLFPGENMINPNYSLYGNNTLNGFFLFSNRFALIKYYRILLLLCKYYKSLWDVVRGRRLPFPYIKWTLSRCENLRTSCFSFQRVDEREYHMHWINSTGDATDFLQQLYHKSFKKQFFFFFFFKLNCQKAFFEGFYSEV